MQEHVQDYSKKKKNFHLYMPLLVITDALTSEYNQQFNIS